MEYTNADVSMYQILDCLVTQYDYKIVNVPGSKNDIWLASMSDDQFPIVRLSAKQSSSAGFEMDYLMRVSSAISMVINKTGVVIVLNTHENSAAYVSDNVRQILVRSDHISDAQLLKRFPLLEKALHQVENNQEECARLTRHLESAQMKKMKEAKKFSLKKAPKVTMFVIILCVIAFLFTQYCMMNGENMLASLVVSGAYYKALVVYANEFYRLLSASFVHFDILSLLFYLLGLYQVGNMIEKVYGKKAYAAILFVSMVMGNLFALVMDSNVLLCGMGSAFFGTLAALMVHAYSTKIYKNRMVQIRLSNLSLIAFIAFMIEATSLYSLLGGFVGGLFIAFMSYPMKSLKPYRIHFGLCFVLLSAMMGYFGFQQYDAYPQNRKFDQAIIKEYRTLGMKDHAEDLSHILEKAYEE